MGTYRRLLQFVRPHRWSFAGTVVCGILAAAFDAVSLALMVPFLAAVSDQPLFAAGDASQTAITPARAFLRQLVGRFINEDDPLAALGPIIALVLVAVLLKNVFVWGGGQMSARMQEYVTRDMRNAVYRHLERLPLGFFAKTKAGQILSRLLNDTAQTRVLVTQVLTQAINAVAVVMASIAYLFATSWQLALVALLTAPIIVGGLQPLLRRLRRGFRQVGNEQGEMTSVIQETVSGIRLVKTFGAEAYEEGRFVDSNRRYSSAMVRLSRTSMLSQPITEVAGTLVAMLVLWIGARNILGTGRLGGPDLVLFVVFMLKMLLPLKQLSQIPTTAQASLASAERLFEVLDTPTEAQLDRGTTVAPGFRDSVRFENVSFAYEAEPVLRDISFEARRGQVVALAGPSGAGKTTLVDLIPRLYEPTGGRILLDGIDTREITLPSLRSLIGIVSQDTVLFNDTVRNNIAYGTAGRRTDAEVEAAARAANAHGFITELPQGYETVLGERGTRLSGGQRQRIAIARALLTDPPILILDEATSALDTESERLVQQALDRLFEGRTVFVIAHRLSTIQNATIILVLEQGRIAERGTHEELLAARGIYARLHELQFRDRLVSVEA